MVEVAAELAQLPADATIATVQNTAITVATPIAVTGTTHACSWRAFREKIAKESTTSRRGSCR